MIRLCLLSLMILTASGCAVQRGYAWGSYEQNLYDHYRDPSKATEFSEKMFSDLSSAEEINRVPPGLYAEYGYLMLEAGQPRKAAFYFNKEKAMWPESARFMGTLTQAAIKANTSPKTGVTQ